MRSYFWIPRVFGTNPETGPYNNFSVLWSYVSDETNPPQAAGLSNRYGQFHLPDWFPSSCLIHKVVASINSSAQVWGQMITWIDPEGAAWFSTTPYGQEAGSNFTRDVTIGNVIGKGEWYTAMAVWEFPIPIPFNRENNDKLIAEIVPIGPTYPISAPCVQIYFTDATP